MDHCFGIDFNPEIYVDITQTFDVKMEMLACHRSQASWLTNHFGMAMQDDVEVFSRFRGLQCGVRYAEGFRQLRIYPRATTERLLP